LGMGAWKGSWWGREVKIMPHTEDYISLRFTLRTTPASEHGGALPSTLFFEPDRAMHRLSWLNVSALLLRTLYRGQARALSFSRRCTTYLPSSPPASTSSKSGPPANRLRLLFPLHLGKMDVGSHTFFPTTDDGSFNEESRLRERYRRLNIEALKKIAADTLGRGACISIAKLAEGGNCKIFLLVMEDGFEVIAKIPMPWDMHTI